MVISFLIVGCYADWWGTIMETSHYYLQPCLLSHFGRLRGATLVFRLLCYTIKAPLCLPLKEKWKTGRFLKELEKLSFHVRIIPGTKLPRISPTFKKKSFKMPSKVIRLQRCFIRLKWPVFNNKTHQTHKGKGKNSPFNRITPIKENLAIINILYENFKHSHLTWSKSSQECTRKVRNNKIRLSI